MPITEYNLIPITRIEKRGLDSSEISSPEIRENQRLQDLMRDNCSQEAKSLERQIASAKKLFIKFIVESHLGLNIEVKDIPNPLLFFDRSQAFAMCTLSGAGLPIIKLNLAHIISDLETKGSFILSDEITHYIAHEYFHFYFDTRKKSKKYNAEGSLVQKNTQNGLVSLNITDNSISTGKIKGKKVNGFYLNDGTTELFAQCAAVFDIFNIHKITDADLDKMIDWNQKKYDERMWFVVSFLEFMKKIPEQRSQFILACIEGKKNNSIKPIIQFFRQNNILITPSDLYNLKFPNMDLTKN